MTQSVAQGRIADRSTECHLTASRRAVYLACEDMDLVWDARDVKTFDAAWKQGFSVVEIANMLGRDTDEVTILAIDRARRGRIQPRKGGAFGQAVRRDASANRQHHAQPRNTGTTQ